GVPANLARLDIDDAGAVLSRRVARRGDTAAVRVPVADRVLRAGTHAKDLLRAGPVGPDHVAVAVLQVRAVLVRDIADPLTVVRPQAPEHGERVTSERCVIGAVRADLPDVELPGTVGRLGKTLVRSDREPFVLRTE